ncbi:MAG TPA: ArsR family transcriptional regulator [Hellea balneolensis]|uniref:ArsR family transcriptional regulator n=1 Tax=Hellea balneolensis TaxID=287478 RepID=A0A7C5R1S4_9PROT|nr:ArsR family transcriptional regulator [Hellea balneolensis]
MSKESRFEQLSDNMVNAASIMKALSSETRLKLMCCLIDGEKSVNVLAEAIGMRMPAVSQHLSKMRSAGLVTSRREAQTIYYAASDGIGHAIVGTLCHYYKPD